jgi:hypothetical protein
MVAFRRQQLERADVCAFEPVILHDACGGFKPWRLIVEGGCGRAIGTAEAPDLLAAGAGRSGSNIVIVS